ncbi:Cytochrome c-type biogenesis protein DsbD, protein-disulfide reductase [Corynebacterium glutamicum]|nr:Cytochrome c-type biogenesis protein DsbD, protein-disulfide reductase [Corynebacterium glutamicum]
MLFENSIVCHLLFLSLPQITLGDVWWVMPGGGSPILSITVNNNLIVGMILWVCLFPVKGLGPHINNTMT